MDLSATEEPGQTPFEEAGSLLGDIADREEAIFRTIAGELGTPHER